MSGRAKDAAREAAANAMFERKWEAATRAMVPDPDTWPTWPRLPMKHRTRKEEGGSFALLGVMVEQQDGSLIIYLTSLFSPITDATPKETFRDVDALINAGWRVD